MAQMSNAVILAPRQDQRFQKVLKSARKRIVIHADIFSRKIILATKEMIALAATNITQSSQSSEPSVTFKC
jgi:hypothetical protein